LLTPFALPFTAIQPCLFVDLLNPGRQQTALGARTECPANVPNAHTIQGLFGASALPAKAAIQIELKCLTLSRHGNFPLRDSSRACTAPNPSGGSARLI